MKRAVYLVLFILLFFGLSAHEFWLQGDKFLYRGGEPINIRFMVGENFNGEDWIGNKMKIKSLELFTDDRKDDLSAKLAENTGDSLRFTVAKSGNALIAFNSTNSFLKLEAAKFNAYLKDDGMRNAVDYRQQHHETDSGSREYYQRSVKTLLQIGSRQNNVYKKETGIPVDIIPLSNPYSTKNGELISFKVLYKQKILPYALVKIWQHDGHKTTEKDLHTDADGLVNFTVNTTGRWMVSTVKMEHVDNDPKANWQSYWGSFTWGYY